MFRYATRKENVAARYGGEEFVTLLINADATAATRVAERLCAAVRHIETPWMRRPVTVSIGVATFPGVEASSGDDLIRAADQALYVAKTSGKDRVEVSASGGGLHEAGNI